jgi:hypothetical protein
MKLLIGHTTPETAYVVGDYPYGFKLRCKIRYWIEVAERGAKKGQSRFMSQTTNPKKIGDPWNTPKSSTYVEGIMVMYLNAEGHVVWNAVDITSRPANIAWMRRAVDALPDEARMLGGVFYESRLSFDTIETFSKKYYAKEWAAFEAKEAAKETTDV